MKHIRILNLGAGVQSTTIALEIAEGKHEPIDAAIFADTQEEPESVYTHLEWLKKKCEKAFPILVRTRGKLGDDLMNGCDSDGRRFASIPCFTKGEGDEREGITRRQCTVEYKVEVIDKTIRREILGLAPRKHFPKKDVTVTQIMGLSAEEGRRVLRVRAAKVGTPFKVEFPLFEKFQSRANCLAYLKDRVPHQVEKSACVFCPYHDNAEWRRIRDTNPKAWARAVQIDNRLRMPGVVVNRNMDQPMYLHRTCVPLEEADIEGPDAAPLQYGLGFERECVGACGV